jgi:cytidylate kinase
MPAARAKIGRRPRGPLLRFAAVPGEPTPPTVIAIDGPAGSGKSTVARELARTLGAGWSYLDSGAMYRAATVAALAKGTSLDDPAALAALAFAVAIELEPDGRVTVDGKDVTDAIRTEPVNRGVSHVAEPAQVRNVMVEHQRKFAARYGRVVADGRDMATVVFPDAVVKIYLDASLSERAKRRFGEMRAKHPEMTLEDVKRSIHDRDEKDQGRATGRLYQHEEAVRVDTTGKTPAQVLAALRELVLSRVPPVAGR